MAGFISERWPTSNRNAGRHQIGISGRLQSESADLPEPRRGARLGDVESTFSGTGEVKAELGLFASLIARIWPGAMSPSVTAKVEANGGRKLFIRLADATRDVIDFARLGRALGTRSPDLSFLEGGDALRLLVVTEVFRSSEIEMSWRDDRGRAIDAGVVVAEAAKLGMGGKVTARTDGSVRVKGDASLAFGVRVIELVPRDDGPGLRMRLQHTPLDVLSAGDAAQGDSADLRDYALLADPWSGVLETAIDPLPGTVKDH